MVVGGEQTEAEGSGGMGARRLVACGAVGLDTSPSGGSESDRGVIGHAFVPFSVTLSERTAL